MDRLVRWIIHACARAAELARLLARMLMKLADQTTAILPLNPTGTAGELAICAPLITDA